ncbi:MAG: hypothetical protein ACRD2R_03790 [Terriglobales bacterium]
MTSIFCLLVVSLLAAVAAPQAGAQGLQIFSIDRDSDQLRRIDPVSGATISSVTITLAGFTVNGGTGLAVDPTTGTMYALLVVSPPTVPGVRRLVTVDPATGVATDIGNANDGTSLSMADITFDSAGVLYGVTGDGSASLPETLFTLNKATGAATLVVALGNGDDGEAIGFNPADGLIYHESGLDVNNGTQILETIDPASPLTPPVPVTLSGDDPDEYTGLVYWGNNFFLASTIGSELVLLRTDGLQRFMPIAITSVLDFTPNGLAIIGAPADCTAVGQICGAANNGFDGPSVFYSINKTTGAASMVGPVGFLRVSGIAFNSAGTLFGAGGT